MAKFNGSEGGEISLEEAASWTANYRGRAKSAEVARSHFFGREILERMLAQDTCVGIRMYHGLNKENKKELILVGVNADGNDLEEGIIADRSSVCPPDCNSVGKLSS